MFRILPLVFLVGCVSTETMDSSHIKTTAIAQTYGVHCDAVKNECTAMAQFRVGDHSGPTLELKAETPVSINGTPAAFFDARARNKVLDAVSYVTVVPIFQLYKTGSYYQVAGKYRETSTFTFTDDDGRTTKHSVEVKTFTAKAPPRKASMADLGSIEVDLKGALAGGERMSCTLILKVAKESHVLDGKFNEYRGKHYCVFDAEGRDLRAGGEYFLSVVRAVTVEGKDGIGRAVKRIASVQVGREGVLVGW